MTEQPRESDDSLRQAGALNDITLPMIYAGREALLRFEGRLRSGDEASVSQMLKVVYGAMRDASPLFQKLVEGEADARRFNH